MRILTLLRHMADRRASDAASTGVPTRPDQ